MPAYLNMIVERISVSETPQLLKGKRLVNYSSNSRQNIHK